MYVFLFLFLFLFHILSVFVSFSHDCWNLAACASTSIVDYSAFFTCHPVRLQDSNVDSFRLPVSGVLFYNEFSRPTNTTISSLLLSRVLACPCFPPSLRVLQRFHCCSIFPAVCLRTTQFSIFSPVAFLHFLPVSSPVLGFVIFSHLFIYFSLCFIK